MVAIRMARVGRVHRPSYTIVAVDSRRSRDGGFWRSSANIIQVLRKVKS